eukprot:13556209-Alexandrium_andersonii.AAC.1
MDGWVKEDLVGAPVVAFEWLALFYAAVEAGMPWPRSMYVARTVMLPKSPTIEVQPLPFRPLSIASL